jgi:hypothetical protein
MGYNVSIEQGTIRIPIVHMDRVYAAMCELNNLPAETKNGGMWTGGEQEDAWFSWMPANYPEVLHTAEQILNELGFQDLFTDQDDLILHSYDSKIGQERLFIASIAPWIKPDSVLYWLGEDGRRWRWTFIGGVLEEREGRIIYQDDPTWSTVNK